MIALFIAFGLLFQTPAAPASLTAQQVLDAHQAGVSAQGLMNMITANPTIIPATDAELLALAQAGVPPAVVDAFRAPLTSPPSAAPVPTDARLMDILKMVRSGLSEDLIIRQIVASDQPYKLSAEDLIYLKNNQVPDPILSALISSGAGSAAKAAAQPATFGPLFWMKGFPRKDATGTLDYKEGRLIWLDDKKMDRNFSLEITSIKTAWLECSPRPQGNFCYALGLGQFNGDRFEFRDFSWEGGGNTQILNLFETLKKAYPQIIYHEKVK